MTATERDPVHRCNCWFRKGCNLIVEALHRPDDSVVEHSTVQFLDISPSNKCLVTGTGEHHNIDRIISCKLIKVLFNPLQHDLIHRDELFGPINRQDSNTFAVLTKYELCGFFRHGSLSNKMNM